MDNEYLKAYFPNDMRFKSMPINDYQVETSMKIIDNYISKSKSDSKDSD